MVLVNGSDGIGTGWSSNIPCFNPRDIVDAIKNKIANQEFENIHPWFKGYNGSISVNDKQNYTVEGIFSEITDS